MHGYYYFNQLRTYSLLLSNLFGQIGVKKFRDGKTLLQPVPVTYGNKEMFISKLNQKIINSTQPDPNYANVEQILPRMNVSLIDIIYDPERKTFTRNKKYNNFQKSGEEISISQFNPVPYKLTYELNVYTRYEDDMLQIVEQIIPYFTPSFICKIVELRENDIKIAHNVPITLIGISPDESVDGGPGARRHLEWSFTLQLNGYIYPPNIDIQGIIKTMYIDLRTENLTDLVNNFDSSFDSVDVQLADLNTEKTEWNGDLIYGFDSDTPIPDDNTIRGVPTKGNVNDPMPR